MKLNIHSLYNFFKKQSINNLIMASMIAIALLLILVVGHNWMAYENRKFRIASEQFEIDYIENQKFIIQAEVDRAFSHINYIRSLSENKLKESLSSRVDIAWEIANNIYTQNKGKKTDAEIQQIIIEALRFFKTDANQYNVFIYTLNGIALLDQLNRSIEGKSCIDLKDKHGNYIIRKETNLLEEVDEGFITYYNRSDSTFPTLYKLSYVKKFKPYGWYIGSKEYISDFEEHLKEDILHQLANIKFDDDGYIFVQKTNNEPVMAAGTIFKKNKVNVFNVGLKDRIEITKLAKQGGGFYHYETRRPGLLETEPKLSYVRLLKEWDWIVGAGFYLNNVEPAIRAKRSEIQSERLKTIARIFVALSLILCLGLFFTYQVTKKIKQGFKRFTRFFEDASTDYIPILESEVSTPEFKYLANSANRMISDLSNARIELLKEHSLLRSIINSIPDFVFFKDIHSKYVGANDSFLNYINKKEEDIKGKTDFELFPQESAYIYNTNDQTILADGIPIRNEEWITLPDGKQRLFDTVKVLCYDDSGSIMGILCISRDITERFIVEQNYIEAKEKAEESDRLKTAFLANMSHEIRTPMNSIVGFSNLIAEGGLTDDEQAEYLEHINTAVNNLLNLINDIIDIAKIEAGQLSVKPEYYSINKLMQDVYASASQYLNRLGKNHIKFNYSIDDEIKEDKILVDPYRLNQILINLITNSMKFTNSGSIHFECKKSGNELLFMVEDTGIGISDSDLELIFQRFRQAGDNNGYKAGGTGLGLAISKYLIEMMNGEISVNSELNKGSKFFFNIPYYPLQLVDIKRNRIADINWKDKVITVIEPADPLFNYLKAVFTGTGAKVIRYTNIEEALINLEETVKIDLLYTELDPANKKNVEVVTKIKTKWPDLPVIAQFDSLSVVNGISQVIDSVVYKPVKYHLLLQTIKPYLANKVI